MWPPRKAIGDGVLLIVTRADQLLLDFSSLLCFMNTAVSVRDEQEHGVFRGSALFPIFYFLGYLVCRER